MKKIFLLLIVAAAGGYWLVLSKPGLYYGKSLEYKNFTLKARGALPENAEGVLDKVYQKLSSAELFSEDQKFDIYLAGGRKEFLFFAPFQNGDYYRVSPFGGAIYIASADFGADQARTAPGVAAYRSLSTELTRAAAAELVRRAVKPLTYLFMRDWKIRGFAERVSGGTETFKPEEICTREKASEDAFLDYTYGQAVEFVMKDEVISFSDLLGKEYSYESVAGRMKKMNCGG
jgi:hypothetical protein